MVLAAMDLTLEGDLLSKSMLLGDTLDPLYYAGVPHTLAKLAIYYCVLNFGY
jgi:hypothetical protein